MSGDGHPCLSGGAFFRVSFYWAEADNGAGQVQAALTELLTPFLRCMLGTNDRLPRCKAKSASTSAAPSMPPVLPPVGNFR